MIGVVAGAVFGGCWGLAGSAGLSGPWRVRAAMLVLVATFALVAAALLAHPRGWRLYHAFDLPVYLIAVAAEAFLIPISAGVLRRRGHARLVPAAVAVVVALHFIGLWMATGTVDYLILTVALLLPPAAAILSHCRKAAGVGNSPLALTGIGSFFVLGLAALSGFFVH